MLVSALKPMGLRSAVLLGCWGARTPSDGPCALPGLCTQGPRGTAAFSLLDPLVSFPRAEVF